MISFAYSMKISKYSSLSKIPVSKISYSGSCLLRLPFSKEVHHKEKH
jgi:hypothetical protein